MARNNDDLINTQGEAVWYGYGCNLMEEMAEDAMLISDWKVSRKHVGRRARKSSESDCLPAKKGRAEITPPEA